MSDYLSKSYPGSVDEIAIDEYQQPSVFNFEQAHTTNPLITLKDGWHGFGSLSQIAFIDGGSITDNTSNLLITNLEVVGLDVDTLTGTTVVASNVDVGTITNTTFISSSADVGYADISSLVVGTQARVDNTYLIAGTNTSTINALISSLGSCTIVLANGRFIHDEVITATDNTSIIGSGYGSEFYMSTNAPLVSGAGSAGNYITNFQCRNFSVTQDSDNTDENDIFSFDYLEDLVIDGIVAHDVRKGFVRMSNCNYGKITENVGYDLGQGFPSTEADLVSAIHIGSGCQSTQVFENTFRNNGNLIVRGDCESTTAPMIRGEVTPVTSNCTWERSDEQASDGTYSYKLTVTSGGTVAYAGITDSISATTDMHGLIAGLTYRLVTDIYLPTAGADYDEVMLRFGQYYSGTWHDTDIAPSNSLDVWQNILDDVSIDGDATGIRIYLRVTSTAASSEYIYVDNIKLIPVGIHNEFGTQYIDLGTGTQV